MLIITFPSLSMTGEANLEQTGKTVIGVLTISYSESDFSKDFSAISCFSLPGLTGESGSKGLGRNTSGFFRFSHLIFTSDSGFFEFFEVCLVHILLVVDSSFALLRVFIF